MKQFKSKKDIFEYLKKKYAKADAILIKGSSIKKGLKQFSDIDVEFYQDTPAKPEYELVLADGKLILITAYPYKAGKEIKEIPNNVLILKGNYYEEIDNQKNYTEKERRIRDNQMFLEFLFKYLRTKDIKYLEKIKKYSRI